MPTVLLEAAEALLPLTLAGLWFGHVARLERRRIALEETRVALERAPAPAAHPGALDRMHEARMRRRALRLLARHHSGAAR
ncbi:MAG TPA: hypothetical protein VII98_03860 [Solirubrobacteraceae bacterium]